MANIYTPSQQFALQQKIARKSIREFQPKILMALQSDFDKAAKLVKDYGVQQTINNRNALFDGKNINNILRTLYESTGGYTAMKYEKIFDKYKKDESVDLDPSNIADDWLAFMLNYWTTYSGTKMYGIENTTKNEITRILSNATKYGQEHNLSLDEVNSLAIKNLKQGQINNARSLLIARTESHQALSAGMMGAVKFVNIPLLKQWVAADYPAKNNRYRDWHRSLDVKTNPDRGGVRIPVNQPFMVNTPERGVIEMQYAHDANGGAMNNCNCRCCTVFIA